MRQYQYWWDQQVKASDKTGKWTTKMIPKTNWKYKNRQLAIFFFNLINEKNIKSWLQNVVIKGS